MFLIPFLSATQRRCRLGVRSSRPKLVVEQLEDRCLLSAPVNLLPNSSPEGLAEVNGLVYFRATDAASGTELWRSDGTANGTVLVKDIFAGPGSSIPELLTSANGKLFFTATDGIHGRELWI